MKKILERVPEWRPEINAGLLGWLLIVGWVILFALALPASAQGAAPSGDVRQACMADIRSLCAGITPGGGRIKQCMIEKHDQLSQGCRDALKNRSANVTERRK